MHTNRTIVTLRGKICTEVNIRVQQNDTLNNRQWMKWHGGFWATFFYYFKAHGLYLNVKSVSLNYKRKVMCMQDSCTMLFKLLDEVCAITPNRSEIMNQVDKIWCCLFYKKLFLLSFLQNYSKNSQSLANFEGDMGLNTNYTESSN